MAQPGVVTAVEARLGEEFAGAAVISANTERETPTDGSPYLLVQYPVAEVERLSVSDRYYQEKGGFRVVIHATRDGGLTEAVDIGDQVAALFRDQKFGGVECRVPSSPLIHDDNEEGMYFVTSVVVPYVFNFRG